MTALTVTLNGSPFQTNGKPPVVGDSAPDFHLVTKALQTASLADFAGKKKILSIVPSLDTPTCAISTKKFNDYSADHPDTAVLIISADLPFAQDRFLSSEELQNVTTLSMMRSKKFAKDYGVLLVNGPLEGLCTRAVLVLDEDNKVIYSQVVEEIADEPDYEPVLAALGK